jgi:hypothetical protein
LVKIEIFAPYNRLYAANLAMIQEHGQDRAQHGLTTDPPELLWQIARRPSSASCGHNYGGDVRHAPGAPEVVSRFSAFQPCRERLNSAGSLKHEQFFAVQHLRRWSKWLNSKQRNTTPK